MVRSKLAMWTMVALSVSASCSGSKGDGVTEKQGALISSQVFFLPVPVGLNPKNITLGASGSLSINDRSRVVRPGLPNNLDGDVTAMGNGGTTNVGVGTHVGRVFSVGNVTIRGSAVGGYVKTTGSLTIQAGSTFGDVQENRMFVNIRQDQVYTVNITTNDTGPDITVPPNTTAPPIGPGTYGTVDVNNGGHLTLTSRGDYFFKSLKLEPGSVLTVPVGGADGITKIWVNSELIIRSPINGDFRTLIGFRGTNVSIDSPYVGGLFMAPNASLDIKANSTGRFFAKNITLFEDMVVTEALSSSLVDAVFLPQEQVFSGGPLAPSSQGQAEISGAFMSTQAIACSLPTALTSFRGDQIIKTTNPFGGSSKVGTIMTMTPPTITTGCEGLLPGFIPDEPNRPYGVLPGFGTPVYSPPFTDNITVRMSGGRALNVGLDIRYCNDPAQGPNCPTAQPTAGTACTTANLPANCYYGANYCSCTGNVWTCGAHNCPATQPANLDICSAATTPTYCNYTTDYCVCAGPPGGISLWGCHSRKRPEGRSLSMHLSNDCGGTWTDAALDPKEIGISNAPATPLYISRSLDRQEVYYDSIESKLYVGFQTSPEFQNFGHAGARGVILSASTTGVNTAQDIATRLSQSWTSGPVRNEVLDDSLYSAMTTVRDERAVFPNGTTGAWSHFARIHCTKGSETPDGATPVLDYDTPFGRRTVDLSLGQPLFRCRRIPFGSPDLGLTGATNVTIAAVQGAPPRIRVAYTSVVSGQQVVIIWTVTLRSQNGYHDVGLALENAISPTGGAHVLFPQFIAPDGQAGSNVLLDTPTVLRWLEASGNNMTEKAQVFYSSLDNALRGPERVVGTWLMSDAFTGRTCPNGTNECFGGDYRYGGFMDKTSGKLHYFTPWTGADTPAPSGSGISDRIRAIGAQIEITP